MAVFVIRELHSLFFFFLFGLFIFLFKIITVIRNVNGFVCHCSSFVKVFGETLVLAHTSPAHASNSSYLPEQRQNGSLSRLCMILILILFFCCRMIV